jgi:nucleoside-diphosphate-sugar epimerase
MKILITGNMGYVGPGLMSRLRQSYPDAELIGYDMGYFSKCLTNVDFLPENKLNKQIFGDVRHFHDNIFEGVDSVVYLAAISNDPMGNKFEKVTMEVNCKSAIKMAESAKKHGVKSFVFASSCSIYGETDDYPKLETDRLNPLTAYARSKVEAENGLSALAGENFAVTCFRFATACGNSDRLRLDLVLNDFVAGAVTSKEISILSDGTPWRPLIHVSDMARAIDFGISRKTNIGGTFLVLNTGSNSWNFQVVELARAVAEVIPGVRVSVNPDAVVDKRSFRVNFDKFVQIAPDYQPVYDLKATIRDLYSNLTEMNFNDHQYRKSQYIRLVVLNNLQDKSLLNDTLNWNWKIN